MSLMQHDTATSTPESAPAASVAVSARPVAQAPADKPVLVGLDRAELAEALAGIGVPERQLRMRVAQLWHWLYVRGASDFADMTNIAKDLRAKMAEAFSIRRPEMVSEQISSDGTRK